MRIKTIKNITLTLCCAAFITACSDNLETLQEEKTAAISLEDAMKESDVEVTLGIGSAENTSRASIESSEYGGYFSVYYNLGVMGVAIGYTPKAQRNAWGEWEAPIKWNKSWQYFDKKVGDKSVRDSVLVFNETYSLWLNNVQAQVTLGQIKLQTKRYYPVGSLHKYNFYAYYPRVDSIAYSEHHITAIMKDLKGYEDVIWGRAIPPANDYYAYSAEYFRSMNTESTRPYLSMTHKMVRFTFNCIAAPTPDASGKISEDTVSMDFSKSLDSRILGISIVNAPDTVKLILADKTVEQDSVANLSGQLSYSSAKRNRICYLRQELNGINDCVFWPVVPKSVNKELTISEGNTVMKEVPVLTPLGQALFMPALSTSDQRKTPYKVRIVMEYPNGTSNFYYKEIELKDAGNQLEYKEGQSYPVTLSIVPPETGNGWKKIEKDDLQQYIEYNVMELNSGN